MDNKIRCEWLDDSKIYIDYHDNEWGRPMHDDRMLFEMLSLEAFQAGLSWITILKKREAFRIAFDNFNPKVVSIYNEKKIEELLQNEKIVRHRGKIVATINNANRFLEIQNKYGSFDKFIWSYVDNTPIIGRYDNISKLPATTPLSDKISKDLKKLGFKFVGSTTIYSFLQATGIVNDHTKDCFLYENSKEEIIYKKLKVEDCKEVILKSYIMYQETKKAWCLEDGEWIIKDVHFIDDWDESKKTQIIENFKWCIEKKGVVNVAIKNSEIIGFTTLWSDLIGKNGNYRNLDMMHISKPYRNMGIGEKLFKLTCEDAKMMGATKLYIGSHPCVKSQAFYKKMGCVKALEIIKFIYESEPLDCQLEYKL